MDEVPTARRLVVLSGPTAVGKGTIISEMLPQYPELSFLVSATTRKPRPNEVEGVHYYFISDEEFNRLIAEGAFLEWATLHGMHRSGTLRSEVARVMATDRLPLLEIDVVGAQNVKAQMPEALLVFIRADLGDIEQRIRGRGAETEEQIQRRLATIASEFGVADRFDVQVVNDVLSCTVHRLSEIIRCYFNQPLAVSPSP